MADVLFIDSSDFEEFPPGGTLSFARHMLAAFGNRLALVGLTTDDTPVGRWIKKSINGVEYDFLAVARRRHTARKPLIPGRLSFYLFLRRQKHRILALGLRDVFVQNPEVILATAEWRWNSICYRFAGLGRNSLEVSRYRGAKYLAGAFARVFLSAVTHANILLAAADRKAIQETVSRHPRCFEGRQLIQFPTRVDTTVFLPDLKLVARRAHNIAENATVLTTTGRIHWSKGWEFLLNTFKVFLRERSDSVLYFVGDGEERPMLEKKIQSLGLSEHVCVTGFVPPKAVAAYLNAADAFIFGSVEEGWSTSLVESLACCTPIVSTDVGGVRDIVTDGQNGYVVAERDCETFAAAIGNALSLDPENVKRHCLSEVEKYALANLAGELRELWPALAYSASTLGG